MRHLVSLTVFCLLLATASSLHGQIQQTENVTFGTTNQSIFDPNPALVLTDTMRLLKDNGANASFFVEPVNINAITSDPATATGFQVLAKFGLDFDMYMRYVINSGSATIDYPVEIRFTKPNDGNYGCSQDVTIKSAYSVKPGYKMQLTEPQADFGLGAQINAGFFGGARACILGACVEDGEDHGNPTFLNANSSNYRNYLVDGYYDYLRISTTNGLEMPWDLVPLIPAPSGVPNYTLPYEIDPAIEAYANIEGSLDQPFREFDKPDQLQGKALLDQGTYKFMDIEFDPIQFQEYITHIPLTFSLDLPPAHLDFDVISIPFIFRNALRHEFRFDPNVKASLDLGRPMQWKEKNGAVIVQSGHSQLIDNFTIGNDLVLTLPDTDPVSITPTARITNQFNSKLDVVFDAAVAVRLMYGNLLVDGVPADGPPLINQNFGFNHEIPLGQVTDNVVNKTFELGGFNTAILNPIQLIPDMTPPVVTTQPATVYMPAAGGFASLNPQAVVLSAFDPQGGTIEYLDVTPNSFDCSQLGTHTVTVTVSDGRCNITTATAFVTVVDNTKPTVVCKNATVYLDPSGLTTVAPANMYQSGSDNCGTVELVGVAPQSFNCGQVGANTVVLTVTDGRGNNNTCSATVTVIDNVPPTVTCKPASVYLNNLGTTAVSPAEIFLSGADNCIALNLTQATPNTFDCGNIGNHNVVLTVTDAHANTAMCSAVVTVLDKLPPTVVCKNATVHLDAGGAGSIATATVLQSAADNCGIVNYESVAPNAFDCSMLGSNVVVLTVNDGHGNTNTCSATVTVRDLIKPVVSCPAPIVRANDPGACGAVVDFAATASDNCSVASLVATPAANSFFVVGTTAVVYTATDTDGNTASCSFSVVVNDTEPPALACPANISLENEPGLCSAMTSYAPAAATDNCGVASVVQTDGLPSGSVFPVGVSYVAYRATDVHGNTSACSFAVEVRDTEAPSLVCPPDLSKPNDPADCSRHLTVIGAVTLPSDNCGVHSVWNDSPVDFPVGETVVTWTIRDVHGNTATCAQNVEIFDQQWPAIACPQNMKIKTDEGYCEASNVAFNATATDNCPGVTVTYDRPQDFLFPIGTTNVTATATDAYAHAVNCVFQVTVEPRPEICNGMDDDCDGLADEVQDWHEVFRVEAADGQTDDQLGSSVAIDGDWALSGAPEAGRAYLLRRGDVDPTEWIHVTTFDNGSNTTGDRFGSSVSLHNGIAVVGAPDDDAHGNDAGAVYVFAQHPADSLQWNLVKTIYANDAASAARFGQSLKIKGQTLLVGATGAEAAYVFARHEGGIDQWGHVQKLVPSDTTADSAFGQSVDFNQHAAVVGAPNAGAGAAYLFDPSNGWIETQKIQPADDDAGDRFAQSVSLEGKRLVAGAPGNDDKGQDAGAVYVFGKNQNGAWVQLNKILDVASGTTGDAFGYSVSTRGDYLAIGAPADDLRGKDAGAVHIFLRVDGGWIPVIALTQLGGQNGDFFGRSLQLQPGTLITGTPGDDIGNSLNRGSAAMFEGLCSAGSAGERENTDAAAATTDLRLAPNPTSGDAVLTFGLEEDRDCVIRAFDMTGRLVFVRAIQGSKGENAVPISLHGLPAGVYSIDFRTGGFQCTRKLVVTE